MPPNIQGSLAPLNIVHVQKDLFENHFLLIMNPMYFEILSTNILSGIKTFSKYKSDKIILACNREHDSKFFKIYNTTYVVHVGLQHTFCTLSN